MTIDKAKLKTLVDRVMTDRRFCADEHHRYLATGVLALLAEIEQLGESHEQVCTNYNRASFASEERGKLVNQLKAENNTLRQDNKAWRLTVEAERQITRVTAEELERLKGPGFSAELAALRKDAERYRWLRDGEYLHAWVDVHPCDDVRRAELTDKAIDAAMPKEVSHG